MLFDIIVLMARKRKEKKFDNEEDTESFDFGKHLKEETVETIVAIGLVLIAVFMLLASVSKAGMVGDKVYSVLTYLLGIGYFLIPFVLLALSGIFLKSLKRSFSIIRISGAVLFVISGLGLIELFFHRGGILGALIEKPLVSLFDSVASGIFMFGILIISIAVLFDNALRFDITKLFKKKEMDEEGFEDEEVEITPTDNTKEEKVEVEKEDVQKIKLKKKDAEEVFIPVGRLNTGPYNPPPLNLLERDSGKPNAGDVKANANIIRRTLQNFGINVEMDEVTIGPSVTRYALKPAEGVKLSKIVGLQNDLSLALAAHPLRIEAPIPGKSLVGIEIPNTSKTLVGLGTIVSSDEFQSSPKPLLFGLGKGLSGITHFSDLAKAPHLLVAGATGSGKSVMIHTIISSLLYRNSPRDLKFIMIDPKRVELTLYNKIPHLLSPVIVDAKKAILALKWAAKEMERRYEILQASASRDIHSYHENIVKPYLEKQSKNKNNTEDAPDSMPYIIIVIDELADIMQAYPRELEAGIVRLAQMSRAVGIHLVLSTQRPSVNVITGLIKANVPSRIALQVASQVDSRTILDQAGAEKLLGAGDMLYLSAEMSKPVRIQSAFVSEKEVKRVVAYLAETFEDELPDQVDLTGGQGGDEQNGLSAVMDGDLGEDDDPMFEEARNIVVSTRKASTTFLQRKLRVGYARAARLMDMLEEKGVVSPGEGAKPREVLQSSDNIENDYSETEEDIDDSDVNEEDTDNKSS